MPESVRAFLESVSEAFRLEGPIYQFGYGPSVGWHGGPPPESGLPEHGSPGCEGSEPAEIDRLEDLVELPFSDNSARTVIAAGALEHVFEPGKAVEEMVRILAPGGTLVVCCSQSNGPSPHGADRYWHPTPQAIQRLLAGLEATLIGWQGGEDSPHTLFGVASKSPVTDTFLTGVNHFLDHFQGRLSHAAAQARWWRRLKHRLTGWARNNAPQDTPLRRSTPAPWDQAAGRRKTSSSARHFYTAQFVLHLPVCEQLRHRLLASCLPGENTGSRLDTSH